MQGKDAAERLLEDIRPWLGAYKRVDVSFCARRCDDGNHIVVARVNLRVAEDEAFALEQPFLQTDRLLFTRSILPITADRLETVVRDVVNEGRLPHPVELRLSKEQEELHRTYYRYRHPMLPPGARVPTVVVTTDGRSVLLPIGELEDFDWELRAATPPYTGMGEALEEFDLPKLQQSDDYCQLVLTAESPAIIAPSSEIRDGILHLSCAVSNEIDKSSVRIGLRLFSPAAPDSLPHVARKALENIEWKAEPLSSACDTLQAEIPVQEARIAHVLLSYCHVSLHDFYVVDTHRSLNFRYTLHAAFDKNLEILTRLSEPTQSAEENFEHGIALILNLLGFSTALHGQVHRLRDMGVDIVATTPVGKIILVECTSGLPNHKSKLSKLCRRVSEARQELTAHGIQLPVLPLLVTALPKDAIESEIEDMERLGVAYASREDIHEALNRAKFHVNPDQLFDEVYRNVAAAARRRAEINDGQ
jgi:hypothetical protein